MPNYRLRIGHDISAITSFASGSDVGSYNGATFLWTPAKTNGVINQASWDIVPTGVWVEIADSNMAVMDSVILAADSSWNSKLIWGDGVTNNYSGFALDAANARLWSVASGGHSGGFGNNGIYRYDAYKGSWTVERMPSIRSLWSSGYANLSTTITYTGCPESLAEENAQRTAGTWAAANTSGNAFGNDEVYWANPTVSGAAGVGDPTSRHTYYASSYNPLTNELYIGSGTPNATADRRVWAYSRTLGRWIWKRMPGIQADGAVNGHVLDDVNGILRIWGAGDGINASYSINVSTGVFDYTSWFPLSGRDAATIHVGRVVTGVEKLLSDYPDRNHYFTYNLDTGVTVSNTWTYGTGISISDFVSSAGPEGQSIAYIPSLDRYWIASPSLWWQLDPTTNPWTALPLTFSGDVPVVPPTGNGHAYAKIMYVPSQSALYAALDGSDNWRVYKF